MLCLEKRRVVLSIVNAFLSFFVYDVSKLEKILSPKINAMQHTASNNQDTGDDDNDVIDFWDKMQKIDNDMKNMKSQLSILRNL